MPDQGTTARALLDHWVAAVNRCDSRAVAALYHPRAQFWGTLAATLRCDSAGIADYFGRFLACCQMQASLGQWQSESFAGLIFVAGDYRFSWRASPEQALVQARARFTFVLAEQDGQWLILQHHSSEWVPGGL